MSAKKQSDRLDAVRDATGGYLTVVLGIACFLLALALVMAGVRIIVGTGNAGAASDATAAIAETAGANANGTA